MIPIHDSPATRRTAWVNYFLIAVNLAAFVYLLTLSTTVPASRLAQIRDTRTQTVGVCYGFQTAPTEVDRFYCEWGFQPREFFDHVEDEPLTGAQSRLSVLLTIVTAMFLHGGWLHIAGNMLFLWVFGDNIEDRLGSIPYLLFYLLGGIAASLVQGLMDPDSVVPVVGASGAVAAVLGAYIWLYPKAIVTASFPVLFFIPLPVPAVIMIGAWFLQNLLAGLATLGNAADPSAGVAWFAHIGGFVFGLLIALTIPRRPPRTARYR
jgi:membrane associated rhomboid family serine protease